MRQATVRAALEPVSDAGCNMHLLVLLLDLVLVCLFPELGPGGGGGAGGAHVGGGGGRGTQTAWGPVPRKMA